MLEQIKALLFPKYQPTEKRWLFLSAFTPEWALISSNGTIDPEKPLEELVELLYHGIIEKEANVQHLAIDVVTEIQQESTVEQLQALNLQEFWLCLVGEEGKSGAILPNTLWVTTVQQALTLVKEKYQLAGNATIYGFRTERIVIT